MTDTAHSPLGPSAAERWLKCPGSVNATRGIADVSSVYADEGSFAHHIAEQVRKTGTPAKQYIGEVSECGRFTVDKEMSDAVQYFVDYVEQFECEEDLNEVKVSYDGWVEGGFGTLDAGRLQDGLCVLADLKYGKGVQISAQDNVQLKLYALGVFQEYGDLYDIERFKLCIVQPRLDWIDEFEISLDDLLVWADKVVEPIAAEALTDTARFAPGEWCRWCKIRETCKTRYDSIKEALLDEIGEIRDPNEMDEDALGEAMDLVPLIKKWAADIESRVEKLVLDGHEIIGVDGLPYKMVAGRSMRSWRDQAEAEKAMRNYKIKVSDMWIRKFISPAQAEKLVAIGKNHPILKKHVVVKQGKPTLVPGSDKRPAFQPSADEMEDLGDE